MATGAVPRPARVLLWLGLGIVIACIMATRIPFFAGYFAPGISADTWSFVLPVVDMLDGRSPLFAVRLPGYPLFVLVTTSLHRAWEPLLLAQTTASLAAGSLMVYAAYRARPWLAVPVAVAMALVFGGDTYLGFETSVVSESLYVCVMIAGFACLLIGLREVNPRWLRATSLLFAYTIWVRPAGMFLIVIVAAAWVFMWWNRYRKEAQLALVLPMVVMFGILAGYNFLTMNVFALSPVGARNIAAATAMFWEQDPGFPADINAAIARMQTSVSADNRLLLSRSWDLASLHQLFRDNYGFTKHVRKFAFSEWFERRPESMSTYREFYEVLPRVARKAIRSHPKIYLKFVASNLYAYFWLNPLVTDDFWGTKLPRRLEQWSAGQTPNGTMLKRFVDHQPSRAGLEALGDASVHPLTLRWATVTARVHRAVTRNRVWVVAYVLVALASLTRVARSRAREPESVFVLLLCAAGFGAALLVSLVEPALIRYSRAAEFIVYLSVVLSPLLFARSTNTQTAPSP